MNDLVTIDGAELADMATILGTMANTNTGGDSLVRVPRLDHQHAPDDEDGNPMPRGEFRLHMPEGIVYAKTVRFRPLASHIQYFLYEGQGKDAKLIKSLPILNNREEARDTSGGIACGMPPWEERAENEELRQKYKDCQRRVVRGLISMDGHTLSGDEVKIENQPTIYFGKGRTNYGGFWSEFVKVLPNGSNIYDYEAELTTERMKIGATVFYKIHWTPDLQNKLPMTREVFETMKVFADTIQKEKKYVDDMYFKVAAENSLDNSAIEAIEDSLDADFEDA